MFFVITGILCIAGLLSLFIFIGILSYDANILHESLSINLDSKLFKNYWEKECLELKNLIDDYDKYILKQPPEILMDAYKYKGCTP